MNFLHVVFYMIDNDMSVWFKLFFFIFADNVVLVKFARFEALFVLVVSGLKRYTCGAYVFLSYILVWNCGFIYNIDQGFPK